MLQIEECKILLNLVYPPIVKLNSLLGRPTCKEQIHYPMEGGSAGAIAKTWQTSRGPSLVSATLHA